MFKDVEALIPLHFLEFTFSCHHQQDENIKKKRYLLPNTSFWLNEEYFADLYFAWSQEGLRFYVDVKDMLRTAEDKQSIELFIDTRGQKNRKYVGIFSHHFLITPFAQAGFYAKEISRFSKEAHSLCAPKELQVDIKKKTNGYAIDLMIPSFCLYGYDPQDHKELSFTYQINRLEKEPQHFTASSEEVNVWQNSYLWATGSLTK